MLEINLIHSLGRLLDKSDNIVLTTHAHADGDALGSSAAFYHWLTARGKKCSVLLNDRIADTIGFIYEGIQPVVYNDAPVQAQQLLDGCGLLLCTDFNGFHRTDALELPLKNCKAPKALVDHHLNPAAEDFDLVISETRTSSSCELVWEILRELSGGTGNIGEASGNALMAGMTTDTNNFANSVYPGTFKMAGELIEAGIDRDRIISMIYNQYRENRVRAISWILGNRLKIRDNGIASLVVTREEWNRFGLKDGELEAMVNIPLTIGKVNICIYLREDVDAENTVRVSIRSRRGWSANALAVKYFHGGGHENASGGKLHYPEDVASAAELEKYIDGIEL